MVGMHDEGTVRILRHLEIGLALDEDVARVTECGRKTEHRRRIDPHPRAVGELQMGALALGDHQFARMHAHLLPGRSAIGLHPLVLLAVDQDFTLGRKADTGDVVVHLAAAFAGHERDVLIGLGRRQSGVREIRTPEQGRHDAGDQYRGGGEERRPVAAAGRSCKTAPGVIVGQDAVEQQLFLHGRQRGMGLAHTAHQAHGALELDQVLRMAFGIIAPIAVLRPFGVETPQNEVRIGGEELRRVLLNIVRFYHRFQRNLRNLQIACCGTALFPMTANPPFCPPRTAKNSARRIKWLFSSSCRTPCSSAVCPAPSTQTCGRRGAWRRV